ncbi:cell division protein FtsQ/DivIB [Alkaliphilus transvaalensis]|uniref:cell division protein FtsQ/DivIB n=1 Tax=Alkaliphilus transvaalensis TaxID=114628 RepID=UPI00047A930A|nr:FtsQ-type POTRA domain-containing protein [Alkaliphilus transvaalensis]
MSNYEEIKKRKQTRIRIKRTITSILLIIVFLLWGIYALLQSDLFNLKVIEVLDNHQIDYDEIFQYSRLVKDRNILKYNLAEIEVNVAEHAYIKAADVTRKLPNKIIINVKERREYAIIAYMGSYIYIDQEGVLLKVTDHGLSQELPLITGAEFQSFNVGEPVDVINLQDLYKVFRLLEAAELSEMLETISEVNISEADNIRLYTFDGIEVQLGTASNPAYLMLALKEVLINLYTTNRRDVIIDLRYDGHITVRDRNS